MKKRGLNIHINFTNRWLYTLIVLGILTIIAVGVYAAVSIIAIDPGHNSTQIFIHYPGGYVSLQTAINNNYLITSSPSILIYEPLPTSTPYHLASQVLITTLEGYIMTLQEAVEDKTFIIAATRSHTTTLPAGGEYANNINIGVEETSMTFQYAITQKKICKSAGQTAYSSYSCCSGLAYSSSSGTCCANSGTQCTSTSQCCRGSCSGGSCVCSSNGGSCSKDLDCCSGYTCSTGTRKCVGSCSYTTCSPSVPCCSGSCQNHRCS